jgi:hypothetical protein
MPAERLSESNFGATIGLRTWARSTRDGTLCLAKSAEPLGTKQAAPALSERFD